MRRAAHRHKSGAMLGASTLALVADWPHGPISSFHAGTSTYPGFDCCSQPYFRVYLERGCQYPCPFALESILQHALVESLFQVCIRQKM